MGPTGATLALLLAQQGVSVIVLEREQGIYPLPRAVHIDDETMRVFQSVGIADSLSDKLRVNPGMRFVRADGELLLDWPRPDTVAASGWYPSYRLHQPDLETLLRDALESQTDVDILNGRLVQAVCEKAHHVEIQFNNEAGNNNSSISCDYVVGCDGAGSVVRQSMYMQQELQATQINGDMEDLGFKQRWLVIDVLLERPRPDLGDHTLQICSPERAMTYCRNPGIRRRWEVALRDDEPDEVMMQPQRIESLLADWLNPGDAIIERSAVYTFRSAIARHWRSGRCLIAGDAAHLTPPFMGQGLCAGIRDAANLAWKLARCCRDHSALQESDAKAALLDSYQAERSPHVRAYIETAMQLGRLMTSLQSDPQQVHMPNNRRMQSIRPRLGASRYMPVDRCLDTVQAADNQIKTSEPLTGRQFPQPLLSTGERLDDAVGHRYLLLTKTDLPGSPPVGLFVMNTREHSKLQNQLDDHGVIAVLIRPDRYVVKTAKNLTGLCELLEYSRQFVSKISVS